MCDRCRAKYIEGAKDEEREDIENDEEGEHVVRGDVENIEDIDSVGDAIEEKEEEKDSVDKNEEKDDEGEENGDSTSADAVDISCSNRLNKYVKKKYARLSERR